jgi:hypothetical protein
MTMIQRQQRPRRGPPSVPLPFIWLGALGGALAAYFLDPDRGRSRRAQMRDQLAGLMRRYGRSVSRQARWSQGPITGLAARLTRSFRRHEPMDDATLAHKVETELFRDPSVPKGRININAENGSVILRGVADSRDQIEKLLATTASIEGVRTARSLLRTPDEAIETAIERARQSPAEVFGG